VFLPDTSKVQLPGEISQQWRTVTFQTNGMGAQTSSRHRFVRVYPNVLGKKTPWAKQHSIIFKTEQQTYAA